MVAYRALANIDIPEQDTPAQGPGFGGVGHGWPNMEHGSDKANKIKK